MGPQPWGRVRSPGAHVGWFVATGIRHKVYIHAYQTTTQASQQVRITHSNSCHSVGLSVYWSHHHFECLQRVSTSLPGKPPHKSSSLRASTRVTVSIGETDSEATSVPKSTSGGTSADAVMGIVVLVTCRESHVVAVEKAICGIFTCIDARVSAVRAQLQTVFISF